MSFTQEQRAAIERREGDLLLAAGAGSGKTSVLVERYVEAVAADGFAPSALLAITFTEKAAGELAVRARRRLRGLGREDDARAVEGGWIDTIHGLCARILRAHPLAAGIDPRFTVLDEVAAGRLEAEAFEDVLDADAVALLAAYDLGRLRSAVLGAHAGLRSRGLTPALPDPGPRSTPADVAPELEAAARELGVTATQPKILTALDRCADLLSAALDPPPAPDDVEALGVGRSEATERYRAALERFDRACRDRHAIAAWARLDTLLGRHAARYAALKRARSALDFADLELGARDLLAARPALLDAYRARFARVMVDEFQDTNPLQLEVIEAVADGNLFTVGDEQQSIYGFRHADVELFRARRDALRGRGAVLELATNFRARPELLAEVAAAFGRLWGEEWTPPRPGRDDAPDEPGPFVELLLTDSGVDWDGLVVPPGAAPPAPAWRLAEARLLAQRIRELVHGGRPPGEIVVLLRATGDLATFERALTDQGLPTYVVGGRGYWGQREVGDLVAWLSVLANPRDELRLYEVLASPLVGVSADALVALGAAAREAGVDPWRALQDGDGAPLGLLERAERDRLAAFAAWARAERERAPRLGPETLIERAVARSGYDRTLARSAGGPRRGANVRKLMRLAREWEAEEGPDLRGFLDLADERAGDAAAESREGEAPIEADDLDAVRLMTIHRAKGLEFGVVCVADLGRSRPYGDDEIVRIGADGRVGLRVGVPGAGSTRPALDYGELGAEQRAAADDEERRLFYVACTRARDRLLLSGSVTVEKWPEANRSPAAWLAPAFVPGIAALAAGPEPRGVAAGVSWCVSTPDRIGEVLRREALAPTPAPSPPTAAGDVQLRLPIASSPAPAAVPSPPVDHLSFSSLEAYARCGYRFYLERVLRLPRREEEPVGGVPVGGVPGEGLAATVRGVLAHSLLETLDVARPAPPSDAELDAVAAQAGVGALRESDRADLRSLLVAFARSPLLPRLAAAGRSLRREEPFSFVLEGTLVTGFIDALAREGARALVVDWKTNRLEGRSPHAVVEDAYALQRRVYALAALKAGAEEAEVAFVFAEAPEAPVTAVFRSADVPVLEAALGGRLADVARASFPVADRPDRELCHGCPGRRTLCSWPREATEREPPT